MKEDGKTIDQRPNKWEVWGQRFRNLGFLTIGLGALVGVGGAVALGGLSMVGGQVVYSSERDMRQTSTKHKVEDKK